MQSKSCSQARAGALATAQPHRARIDPVYPRSHADERIYASRDGRDLARRNPTRENPPAIPPATRTNRQKRVPRNDDVDEEGTRGLPRFLISGPHALAVQHRGYREAIHLREGHPQRGHRLLLRRILRVRSPETAQCIVPFFAAVFPTLASNPTSDLTTIRHLQALGRRVGRAHAPRVLPRRCAPHRPRPGAG